MSQATPQLVTGLQSLQCIARPEESTMPTEDLDCSSADHSTSIRGGPETLHQSDIHIAFI